MNTVKSVLLLFIISSLLTGTGFAQNDEVEVIERYTGSINLPTHIAYNTFLSMLEARYQEPESAYRYVAKATGLDLSSNDDRFKIESLTEDFLDAFIQLQAQISLARTDAMCSQEPRSKSFDEVVDSMNLAHKNATEAMKASLEYALEDIVGDYRTQFLEFLDEVKKSTSYTELESGSYYRANPQLDIYEEVEAGCEDPLPTISSGGGRK